MSSFEKKNIYQNLMLWMKPHLLHTHNKIMEKPIMNNGKILLYWLRHLMTQYVWSLGLWVYSYNVYYVILLTNNVHNKKKNNYECWIDPFPIIGFYLYHVISADQSNNWTTSGMWNCSNLLLILNASHLYLWRLKHKPKGKWQLYVAQLYMMTKRVNFISYLSNLRWTKPWRLLFKWFVYRHILPQLFPLLLTKALVRWRVSLRVYTIY